MKQHVQSAFAGAALASIMASSWCAPPGTSAPTVATAPDMQDNERFSRPFELYDAKNRFVGRMWTPNMTEISVNGHRYVTGLVSAAQENGEFSPVLVDYALVEWFFYYTSSNCQGRAYAPSGGADMPYGLVEQEDDGRLLFYALGNRNQPIEARSFYGALHGCVPFDPPETIPLARVADPVDITHLYGRPFRVR